MKVVKFMNLVRRRAIFKPDKRMMIPYNYNHDVMKAIYYYISIADKQQENSYMRKVIG